MRAALVAFARRRRSMVRRAILEGPALPPIAERRCCPPTWSSRRDERHVSQSARHPRYPPGSVARANVVRGSLLADLEAEASPRRMGAHRQPPPVDLVGSRRQRLEGDLQQIAARADPRSALIDPRTGGIAHLDRAERR